jgi:hypothetical protein
MAAPNRNYTRLKSLFFEFVVVSIIKKMLKAENQFFHHIHFAAPWALPHN